MRLSGFLRLSGAVLALGCCPPPPRAAPVSTHVWSDAELLDYVLIVREQAGSRAMPELPNSRVLGQHNGTTLVQTVSTDDVCCSGPDQFAVVVHYQLANGSDCASVAGVIKSLRVPNGYSTSIRQFCFPKILADHWQEVARKMTPD